MSALVDYAQVAAAGANVIALVFIARQIGAQTKSTKAQVTQGLAQEMLSFDRWLAENPHYKEALRSDHQTDEGAAAAEVFVDLMDLVLMQGEFLDEDYLEPWIEYFRDMLVEWPAVLRFLLDHEHWYGEYYSELGISKLEESTPGARKPQVSRAAVRRHARDQRITAAVGRHRLAGVQGSENLDDEAPAAG